MKNIKNLIFAVICIAVLIALIVLQTSQKTYVHDPHHLQTSSSNQQIKKIKRKDPIVAQIAYKDNVFLKDVMKDYSSKKNKINKKFFFITNFNDERGDILNIITYNPVTDRIIMQTQIYNVDREEIKLKMEHFSSHQIYEEDHQISKKYFTPIDPFADDKLMYDISI